MIRAFFVRNYRLLASIAALTLLLVLFFTLSAALVYFILGLVIAYLLMPVIRWGEAHLPILKKQPQAKRVTLIIALFLIMLGIFSLFSYLVATTVIDSTVQLVNNAPVFVSSAVHQIQEWLTDFRTRIPPDMQQPVDDFIHDMGVALGQTARNSFMRGVSVIPGTLNMFFGLAAIPLFLFFVLKDWEKMGRAFYSLFPTWAQGHAHSIMGIVEGTLGRYIRAQLILSAVVGFLVFVGLSIMQIPFAPVLGTVAAVTESIPTVGPLLAGTIAVIVSLAIVPEKVLWVAILYVLVQLLENQFVSPRVQGAFLRMNPAVILVLLVVGQYIAGLWGMLLIVPLAATAIEIYKYVRQQVTATARSKDSDF